MATCIQTIRQIREVFTTKAVRTLFDILLLKTIYTFPHYAIRNIGIFAGMNNDNEDYKLSFDFLNVFMFCNVMRCLQLVATVEEVHSTFKWI